MSLLCIPSKEHGLPKTRSNNSGLVSNFLHDKYCLYLYSNYNFDMRDVFFQSKHVEKLKEIQKIADIDERVKSVIALDQETSAAVARAKAEAKFAAAAAAAGADPSKDTKKVSNPSNNPGTAKDLKLSPF